MYLHPAVGLKMASFISCQLSVVFTQVPSVTNLSVACTARVLYDDALLDLGGVKWQGNRDRNVMQLALISMFGTDRYRPNDP